MHTHRHFITFSHTLDPKPTVTSVGFAASNSQMLRPIAGGGRVYGNGDLIGKSAKSMSV